MQRQNVCSGGYLIGIASGIEAKPGPFADSNR